MVIKPKHSIFNRFNPVAYVNEYYKNLDTENLQLLRFEFDQFISCSGSKWIEFGNGGVLSRMLLLAAMEVFGIRKEKVLFYISDYNKEVLEILHHWKQGKQINDYNWVRYTKDIVEFIEHEFKCLTKLPNNKIINLIHTLTRQSMVDFKRCNIFNNHPMGKKLDEFADVLILGFVNESAIPDVDENEISIDNRVRFELWKTSLKNTLSLVSRNGRVLIEALGECTLNYPVGKSSFNSVYVTHSDLEEILISQGFKINAFSTIESDKFKPRGYEKMLCVAAQKIYKH